MFLYSAARLAEDFVPNSFCGFYTVGTTSYSHSADEAVAFVIHNYTIIHCTQSYGFCGVLHCNQPFLLLYFNMTYWTFTEELLSKVLSGKTQGFVTFSHRSNECLLVISLTAFKGNLKIKNLQKGLQYVGKCLRRWLSMLTLKYYPI